MCYYNDEPLNPFKKRRRDREDEDEDEMDTDADGEPPLTVARRIRKIGF